MKKLINLLLAVTLTCGAIFSLTACTTENSKTVKDGDKIVVGVTDYDPMDYLEGGKWVGFDAELAELVFTSLGYTVEFKEIDWDTKIVTLNSGSIDVIWNGMTVTDELLSNVLLSNVYLENRQVAIVKIENEGQYVDKTNLTGKKVAVESGSAAEGALGDIDCVLNKLTNQNSAVMEVAAGTSDVAVVDYTMGLTLTTKETSDYYGKLAMVDLGFELEEFAIAFRKSDSKLCWNVNKKISEFTKDGTVAALAAKYGVENLLIAA